MNCPKCTADISPNARFCGSCGFTLAVAEPPKQRKWETGPLEVQEAPKPTEEDEVEVKGEYYPVLIHHKKEKHEGDEKK